VTGADGPAGCLDQIRPRPLKHQPTDHLIDVVARAIYRTHWRAPSPTWDNASASVRDWVKAQARAAIEAVNAERLIVHGRRRIRASRS
jgi:hypothetical protein